MKFLAGYAMRGPMQAVLVAAVCALLSLVVPPLSYLGGGTVALVTLRLGSWQGAKVMLGAALAVTALSLLVLRSAVPGPAFLVALWLPVWVLALELRRSVSLRHAMVVAGGFGALFVIVLYGALDNPAAFWHEVFEKVFSEAGGQAGDAMAEAYGVMTGALAAGFTLSLLGSLFIARWWQALLYNPGGFQSEFHALRFGPLLGLGTLAVASLAFLGDERLAAFASDLVIVLIVLLLLHGIAVVHGLVRLKGVHGAWLGLMYVLLLFMLPQTAITLSAVGLADAWFDFRAFFGAKREEGGK
ncbi:MAG: hypothetical protein M0R77_12650 [Gammaproteobacteria bacterium]|nr:hypothetical protein [Gammaproteobacteria bacterium]